LQRQRLMNKVIKNLRPEDFVPPLYFKFKKYIFKNLTQRPDHKYVHPIIQTYSWEYEDLILSEVFKEQNKGNYLDIGCNDPILGNNTFRFYRAGWQGVNVDLDFHNIEKYKKIRPRDLSLCEVISNSKSEVKIMRQGDDTSISKIDISHNFNKEKENFLIEVRYSMTLFEIYDKYIKNKLNIDILTIDTEGNELDILLSNKWDIFRPTTVCVEINTSIEIIQDFFTSVDYILIFFNPINAIFLDLQTTKQSIKNKFIN
jgi:hypothetical protein